MGEWFSLVHEKNALVRWEQELLVRAKELELEDRHVRLENELRHRMTLSGKSTFHFYSDFVPYSLDQAYNDNLPIVFLKIYFSLSLSLSLSLSN